MHNIFYFSLLPSTDLIKTSNNFHQFSLSQYHNKNLTPTLDTGKNIGTWKQLGLRPAIRSTVSKFKMYNMDRSGGGGGFCKMKFITIPNYQKYKHTISDLEIFFGSALGIFMKIHKLNTEYCKYKGSSTWSSIIAL